MLFGRARWWVSWGLLFGITGLWSLSTPIFSGPDEPSHVVKAAAVARGQLIGQDALEKVPEGVKPKVVTVVRVPAILGKAYDVPECYAFRPNETADCAPAFTGPRTDAATTTSSGHYPPLYYAIAGLPSLAATSVTGIYLMRLLVAAVSAAFLASALESAVASRRRGALALGTAVAMTPMVFYVSSIVNPSGLEIAAALCLWVSSIVLLLDLGPQAGTRLVTRVGVAGSALVLTRTLSPLWLVVIGSVTIATAQRANVRSLLRRREARRSGTGLVVASGLALSWILLAGALESRDPRRASQPVTATIRASLGGIERDLREMVGAFGWLDVNAPALTYYVWIGAVGGMILAGLAFGRRRYALAVAVVLAAVIILPVVLESVQAAELGFFWGGRYTLPLATGLPVLAAFAIGDRMRMPPEVLTRVASVLLGALALGHLLAYAVAVRRFSVGTSGPVMYMLPGAGWSPPLPAAGLLAAFVLGLTVLALWLRALCRGTPSPAGDGSSTLRSQDVEEARRLASRGPTRLTARRR